MNFNEFQYTRIPLETIQSTLTKGIEALEQASTPDLFLEAHAAFNTDYRYILNMMEVCLVRYSINTLDTFYEQEQDYWDETSPYITQLKTRHDTVLLDSPHLEAVQDSFPQSYLPLLRAQARVFNDAILDDLQLENKLITQYNKLISSAAIDFEGETLNLSQLGKYTQNTDRTLRKKASDAGWAFFESQEAAIDEIFDSLVAVRTKMAHTLGYENYIGMGYDRMTRLDYTQDMVETYRASIRDSIVPRATKLYQRQAKRIGVESLQYYDINLDFLDGNATPIGDFDQTLQSGREMYQDLSPETHEFFETMVSSNLLDLDAKKGKQSGGYMTFFYDLKLPFIFSNFNGTSGDVDVLTHEAGHAFQGYMSRDIELPECVMPTYEACEIHSMSMEFITWPYMQKFFGDKADKYRFTHLASSLQFLPYGAQVDHFQHDIYENPTWSPKQRKDAWKALDAQYRPHLDFSENPFADSGTWWFKQGHIFASPFYYIDYTLAQVCAFQFWKRFNIDHDENAWHDYVEICRVGGTQSFLQIVETANLTSPFKPELMETIASEIEHWLDSVDDSRL